MALVRRKAERALCVSTGVVCAVRNQFRAAGYARRVEN